MHSYLNARNTNSSATVLMITYLWAHQLRVAILTTVDSETYFRNRSGEILDILCILFRWFRYSVRIILYVNEKKCYISEGIINLSASWFKFYTSIVVCSLSNYLEIFSDWNIYFLLLIDCGFLCICWKRWNSRNMYR